MRKINKLYLLALFSLVGLSACGGGADVEQQQIIGGGAGQDNFLANASPAELAYHEEVYQKLSSQSRCGRCHSAVVNQAPVFVHDTSLSEAYSAAVSLAPIGGELVMDLSDPANSALVRIFQDGSHTSRNVCWLGTEAACATAVEGFIANLNTATTTTTAEPQGVELVAPPIIDIASSKTFPDSSGSFSTSQLYTMVRANCAACHSHSPTRGPEQSPFFASGNVDEAYAEIQQKLDLITPINSRLVYRLREQPHNNCWDDPATPETDPDCEYSATEMENAIAAYSATIPTAQVDPNLVVSKALRLTPPEALVASTGERHVSNQVALWEFKNPGGDPNASTAYDTSGIEPLMPLDLYGDYEWVGGYGIKFNDGRGFSPSNTSEKLHNMITSTGEYSVEAWVIPANVVQQNRNIITYSRSTDLRNFSIAQNEYNYQFHSRSDETNSNAAPHLETNAADEDLQATQQHIVMTYDPDNGRRIYVNGEFTDDVDPLAGGGYGLIRANSDNPANTTYQGWDDTYAFMVANELGANNPWSGTIRMIAVHNRVLSDEQITQNFEAGVGEKFFLLFSISHIPGVPADSYIKVQAEQFDSYSYHFSGPEYVNLGANPPSSFNIPIKGMRIGINGQEAIVGQAFINLDVTSITANNERLSRQGSLIELKDGKDADYFFLSFETLGSDSNPFVYATPDPNQNQPADLPDQSKLGVKTFAEVNATMSELTGVPVSNSAVATAFNNLKQQLPTSEDINAFVPANIIGITQLAYEYCDRMVEDTTIMVSCERTTQTEIARECLFGDSTSFNFSDAPDTAFNNAGDTASAASDKKQLVVNRLYDRMIGTGLNNAPPRDGLPADNSGLNSLMYELVDPRNNVVGDPYTDPLNPVPGNAGNLYDRLRLRGAGTNDIVKAMCTTVLSNAALQIQ